MFDLEAYYQEAFSGETVDNKNILCYIRSFPSVILWGASFQGKAIGQKLLSAGVKIDCYWDIRSEEIRELHGLPVLAPFSSQCRENTLVIVCIGNRVIFKRLFNTLRSKGYNTIIPGDYLYMGLLCPFDKSTGIHAQRCSGTMECRQIYCHRLGNIIRQKFESERPIHLTSITLIVNQRCSLQCKFCTSYMNEYAREDRIDIPLKTICRDIDVFFDIVDSVGTITVMGGEPFMHPHLSEIVQHLCSKKNFGLISIATSGTYPIRPEQLLGLRDDRVNVSFSNYTKSINIKQRDLYHKNIALVKGHHICCTEGLFSPEWIVPSTLYDLHSSEEEKRIRKSKCTHWLQIKNSRVYPCDLATALHSLRIAEYPTDFLDLTEKSSREMLKEKLRAFLQRPYYESCGHHLMSQKMTALAAEQGYMDFKQPYKE